MELCWHFGKFNWRAFRKRVPASLVSEWCDWLARNPQGERHRDRLLSDIASSLLAAQGVESDPKHFIYYRDANERTPVVLNQAAIDAQVHVMKAYARANAIG